MARKKRRGREIHPLVLGGAVVLLGAKYAAWIGTALAREAAGAATTATRGALKLAAGVGFAAEATPVLCSIVLYDYARDRATVVGI